MSYSRALVLVPLLAALAACTDKPTDPRVDPEPTPKPAPLPLGVFEIQLTGMDGSGGDAFSASKAIALPGGPSSVMSAVTSGISLEVVSSSTFTEGTRGQGGQRYLAVTYRVRNTTGGPLTNLTLIPVTTASTISGTPFSTMFLFNNSAASPTIAQNMVPTGAAFIGEDGDMRSRYPDVLQVFTEAEVAAIPLPAGNTGIFPYGFVVSNPGNPSSRTLPNAANPNDWGGIVTFAFRYPLQATAAADPFFSSFQVLAVQDTETRMTESFEERDTASVRRLRARATALGATTVTVLNGSQAMDPFVTNYPGQRQICSARTAGTPGSPVTFINNPAAYTRLLLLYPGESMTGCAAYFRTGTPARPATNVAFTVRVRAVDRYGNLISTAADTVGLRQDTGPPTDLLNPPEPLVSGGRNLGVRYTDYGTSIIGGLGRRNHGWRTLEVAGVTRNWTAGAGTSAWATNGNWGPLAPPMYRDSVIVPGALPHYPVIASNVTVRGVQVNDGATLNLSSFDLTVNGDVQLGNTGALLGTGRLLLGGSSNTIGGGISNFDVRHIRITESGRYSVTSNINVTGGRIVVQGGRLRSQGYRVRVRPS